MAADFSKIMVGETVDIKDIPFEVVEVYPDTGKVVLRARPVEADQGQDSEKTE